MSVIAPSHELIIFDFYDTLFQIKNPPHEWEPRKGLDELLSRLKGRTLAIATDDDENRVKKFLGERTASFSRIYDGTNCFKELGEKYKNLGKVCTDLGVSPKKTIFLGDNRNNTDKLSADKYQVQFFEVPRVYKDMHWSLTSLVD